MPVAPDQSRRAGEDVASLRCLSSFQVDFSKFSSLIKLLLWLANLEFLERQNLIFFQDAPAHS
jgi:hypothetical protein